MSQTDFTSLVLSDVFYQISRKCCAAQTDSRLYRLKTQERHRPSEAPVLNTNLNVWRRTNRTSFLKSVHINTFRISCHSQCNNLATRVLVFEYEQEVFSLEIKQTHKQSVIHRGKNSNINVPHLCFN